MEPIMTRRLANYYGFQCNDVQLGGASCDFDTGMREKPVYPACSHWDVQYRKL